MAVLVRIGSHKIYKGYEIWDPEYQNRANEFDQYIKSEINRIEKEVVDLGYMKEGGIKDARCHYWVGGELKKIINHKSLHKIDKRWVLDAINFHAPYPDSRISHKNRTKNRIAYNYDLFLNEIPKSNIEMLPWGEWTTIFDTNAFHSDKRSMEWLKNNLGIFEKFKNKRVAIRKLVPQLNASFCKPNRDLSFLSDEEFLKEINDVVEKFLAENLDLLKE
tara:strand:- start:1107 stop:1763 length:657 start_codon:yes stop_codon:yes gene_type:complete